MGITDELRTGGIYRFPSNRRVFTEEELTAIADRIDAEAKANRVDAYTKGYDEGFASADDWVAQHEDAMAEHGWVRLPVSEDGDVLHIGELVDERLPFGGYAAPAPVDTMELSRGAGGYGWMVRLDSESGAFINPKLLRHHHAPTVEDVLREFVERLDEIGSEDDCGGVEEQECRACIRRDIAAAYAEYAAKLRLVGDE